MKRAGLTHLFNGVVTSIRYDKFGQLFGLLALLSLCAFGGAQTVVSTTLDLNELDAVPATIEVSPNYLTLIEFEDIKIDQVSSARPDQITTEILENIVRIRADQEVVNTDLFVRAGGRTALFTLISDPDAQSPKRYLVRDEQPPDRGLRGNSVRGGLSRPADAETLPLPPGLALEVDAYRPSPDAVVLQYILSNNSDHPFVNDPQRLRIYADSTTVPYERTASPTPSRAGRLAVGEAEYGQIVVPNVPEGADSLVLEWPLVEIGPGTVYRATRDLRVALGEKAPAVLDAPQAEAPGGAAPTSSEAGTDNESSAEAGENAPRAAPPAPASGDAQPPVPAEFAAAMDAVATDRILVGGIFETDEYSVLEATLSSVTTESLMDTWYALTHENAEAEAEGVDGAICLNVTDGGAELWDVVFGYAGFPLVKGQTYHLRFDAYADKPIYFRPLVGNALSPFTESFAQVETLSTRETFFYRFEGSEDSDISRVTFFLGGGADTPYRVCFDNIILSEVGADAVADAPDENTPTENTRTEQVSGEQSGEDAPAGQIDGGALVDEDFESEADARDWAAYAAPPNQGAIEAGVEEGAFCSVTTNSGPQMWNVGVLHEGLALEAGQTYTLAFDAYADKPVSVRSAVTLSDQPWAELFGQTEELSTEPQSYRYTFEAPSAEEDGWLVFFLGGNGEVPYRVCFDRVALVRGDETVAGPDEATSASADALLDASFEQAETAQAWSSYTIQQAQMDYEVTGGEVCTVTRDGGEALWDVGLFHPALPFEDDRTYTLSFEARADKPVSVRPAVTLDEVPWTEIFGQTVAVGTETQAYDYTFEAVSLEAGGRLIFFLGNNEVSPYQVCFDNVRLSPTAEPEAATSTASDTSRRSALLVTGPDTTGEVVDTFEAQLSGLGFEVSTKDNASLSPADLGVDIVVVSPSADPTHSALLRDTTVPVVVAEAHLFAPLGMTGDAESIFYGVSGNRSQLELVAPAHPLSAGLSGTLTVAEGPRDLAWGTPSGSAVVVAAIPDDEMKAAVFAYEAGTLMVSRDAPARRVGLFHNDQATYSSEAWTLFGAAVRWAAQTESDGSDRAADAEGGG